MSTLLLIIIFATGIIFAGTVLIMSPKWDGLWAIGGMSFWWSNEYWSKKSLQTTLKKVALLSGAIFAIASFIYPYV